MSDRNNKTALVTGASRGIGRAVASALADAGAHVLVHYGQSASEAESLVDDIRSKGQRADSVQANLGTAEGPAQLAQSVRSIVGDRLDILVANAGVGKATTIQNHTQNGDWPRNSARNAGIEAYRQTRRCSGCSRVPRLGQSTLDYRSQHSRGRRIKTLAL